jgi:hypothetical protein
MFCLIMTAATLSARAASDDPRQVPSPEQIRQKMAHVRAELERVRREMGRGAAKGSPAAGIRTRPTARPPIAGSGRTRSRGDLVYHFNQGQSLAYSVEIEAGSESSDRVDRFTGTPYVTVKSVDPSGEAELFVIGKLECSTVRGNDGEARPHPKRAVWLGSRIALKPSGQWVGKPDVNAEALPGFFRTLNLYPKQLIFPEMPRTLPGVDDEKGNASLFVTFASNSLLGPRFGSLDGRATRTRHADPIELPLARLTHEVLFQTNESVKPAVKIAYRSVSRFDRGLGLLRDSDTTFRQEQEGASPLVGTIRTRWLQGDALRKAYERASEDWQERPEELDPFEFRRVRVEAFLPASLKTTGDARPGMTVIHLRGTGEGYNDGDGEYYLAEVLEADSGPQGLVKIRYKGSDEVLSVHPGTLAIPPAAR